MLAGVCIQTARQCLARSHTGSGLYILNYNTMASLSSLPLLLPASPKSPSSKIYAPPTLKLVASSLIMTIIMCPYVLAQMYKCSQLSAFLLYVMSYVFGFRADHVVLGNQEGVSSLGEANPPTALVSSAVCSSLPRGVYWYSRFFSCLCGDGFTADFPALCFLQSFCLVLLNVP